MGGGSRIGVEWTPLRAVGAARPGASGPCADGEEPRARVRDPTRQRLEDDRVRSSWSEMDAEPNPSLAASGVIITLD